MKDYGRGLIATLLSNLIIYVGFGMLMLPGVTAYVYLHFVLAVIIFESTKPRNALKRGYAFVFERCWPMFCESCRFR